MANSIAIANTDARRMQPLPWTQEHREQGRCVSLYSVNGKAICSFWGGDTRHPQNHEWCTEAQMEAHAKYAQHACNHFPHIQAEIERLYAMEDMPEEAIKAIEALMEKVYFEGVPPYAPSSR